VRVVVQRVRGASVRVDGGAIARIDGGLLAYVGISSEDGAEDIDYIASKVTGLRVFEDDEGRMNRSVLDVGGAVLLISQFTLYGDTRKGRRPSYNQAAAPHEAEQMYEELAQRISKLGTPVQTGKFQAKMLVSSENDGPVTILIDSKKEF